MPARLERCVERLRKKGKSKDSAWAICTASVNRAKRKKKGS